MSHVDTAKRYYELVDANDIDGLLGVFAYDAVYERPGYDPLVGHQALRDFYSGVRVIASGHHVITNLVDGGDKVAAEGTFEGTLRDGSDVFVRWADFWTFGEDNRATRRNSYFHVPAV